MPSTNQMLAMALDPCQIALKAGITPDPWQRDFLRCDDKEVLLLCSRQAGKSTVTSMLAVHELLFVVNALVLLFSPTLRQSKELLLKVKAIYGLITGDGGGYLKERTTSVELELSTGARVVALPGDSESNLRGYSSVTLALCDEASRILDSIYFALRPMVAISQGRIVEMSTFYGRRGHFYENWTNGGSDFKRFDVPATLCPRISQEFLDREKRNMPPWAFMQEYMNIAAETTDQVFYYKDIESMFTRDDFEPAFGSGEELLGYEQY